MTQEALTENLTSTCTVPRYPGLTPPSPQRIARRAARQDVT
jgi:hypothetical protein